MIQRNSKTPFLRLPPLPLIIRRLSHTKVPDVPSATNQIALNLSLLGGDADDGFIGYADDNARQIGLLSSIDLGGVALETGTATWSVVMEWILGDGSDGILTQNFTLAVDFDARTLTFGGYSVHQ